jgi:hypothetical protein
VAAVLGETQRRAVHQLGKAEDAIRGVRNS